MGRNVGIKPIVVFKKGKKLTELIEIDRNLYVVMTELELLQSLSVPKEISLSIQKLLSQIDKILYHSISTEDIKDIKAYLELTFER